MKGRLLSLDGGGVRGVIVIVMLMIIQKVSKRSIQELFDVVSNSLLLLFRVWWLFLSIFFTSKVAGTSAGGIIALCIGAKIPLEMILVLFLNMKDQVFVDGRVYPSEPIERLLKEFLGETTRMSDLEHPKIIVTATIAEKKQLQPLLFRNYESAQEILWPAEHSEAREMFAYEAERSTSESFRENFYSNN